MRNALGRRIALKRPSDRRIGELRARLFQLEAAHERTAKQRKELKALRDELDDLLRRRKLVPYLDPLDVRYNAFAPQPVPTTAAVIARFGGTERYGGSFERPGAMAASPDGAHLYVLDTRRYAVLRFEPARPDARPLVFGQRGENPGQSIAIVRQTSSSLFLISERSSTVTAQSSSTNSMWTSSTFRR